MCRFGERVGDMRVISRKCGSRCRYVCPRTKHTWTDYRSVGIMFNILGTARVRAH